METKTRGEYRNDFYKIFEGMVGRKIEPQEHNFLKALLQNYLKDCEPTLVEQKPIIRHYICDECLVKSETVGHKPYKAMEIRRGRNERRLKKLSD